MNRLAHFLSNMAENNLVMGWNTVCVYLEVKWKSLSHVQLFATPWNSPGQNIELGSLFLLQGIFPTQGSHPGLPHWRRILYQQSHKGSPVWTLKAIKAHHDFQYGHAEMLPAFDASSLTGVILVLLVEKNLPANAEYSRDRGSIPGSGRSPEGGNSNSLQYSCLENPMDRGAWWAIVHGIAELDTTEPWSTHTHIIVHTWQLNKL